MKGKTKYINPIIFLCVVIFVVYPAMGWIIALAFLGIYALLYVGVLYLMNKRKPKNPEITITPSVPSQEPQPQINQPLPENK